MATKSFESRVRCRSLNFHDSHKLIRTFPPHNREVLQYANLSPYATMKDKKYHDQVTKLVSNFGRESRLLTAKKIEAAQWSLFTYIDSDDYIDIEDTQREIISNPGMDTAVLSPLARRIFGDNSVNRERSMSAYISSFDQVFDFLYKSNSKSLINSKNLAWVLFYSYFEFRINSSIRRTIQGTYQAHKYSL